jgi:hypothetical protein
VSFHRRRWAAIIVAITVAWPLSLWAVGYGSARFVRNSNLAACEKRAGPRDRAAAAGWRQEEKLAKKRGEKAAALTFGATATTLEALAATPCVRTYPVPPVLGW